MSSQYLRGDYVSPPWLYFRACGRLAGHWYLGTFFLYHWCHDPVTFCDYHEWTSERRGSVLDDFPFSWTPVRRSQFASSRILRECSHQAQVSIGHPPVLLADVQGVPGCSIVVYLLQLLMMKPLDAPIKGYTQPASCNQCLRHQRRLVKAVRNIVCPCGHTTLRLEQCTDRLAKGKFLSVTPTNEQTIIGEWGCDQRL